MSPARTASAARTVAPARARTRSLPSSHPAELRLYTRPQSGKLRPWCLVDVAGHLLRWAEHVTQLLAAAHGLAGKAENIEAALVLHLIGDTIRSGRSEEHTSELQS